MARALALVLSLVLLVAPVAAEVAQPQLLGVTSGVATTGTGESAAPAGWLSQFGSGFLDGLVHAIPNLIEAFRADPLTTTLLAAGMIGLGIAAPAAALVAGAGLLALAAWQTGGDPAKLGQLAGETAFWGALGFAGARAVKAVKAARGAPTAAAVEAEAIAAVRTQPPIRPGEAVDLVTKLPLRRGQTYHGQVFDLQTGRPLHPPHEQPLATAALDRAEAAALGKGRVWELPADRERLVVGGGRAGKLTGATYEAGPKDWTVDRNPDVLPDAIGDARYMNFRKNAYRDVYFENFDYPMLIDADGAALRGAVRGMQRNGNLAIHTGGDEGIAGVLKILAEEGMKDVHAKPAGVEDSGRVSRWLITARK